jgi:hypothetical protein
MLKKSVGIPDMHRYRDYEDGLFVRLFHPFQTEKASQYSPILLTSVGEVKGRAAINSVSIHLHSWPAYAFEATAQQIFTCFA